MSDDNTAQQIMDYVNRVLDEGYHEIADPVLASIMASMQVGVIDDGVKALKVEAKSLSADGKKLTANNPVFRAFLGDYEQVTSDNAQDIKAASAPMQLTAVIAAATIIRQLAFPGLSDDDLEELGISWVIPATDDVNDEVGIAQSQAWFDELDLYIAQAVGVIANQVAIGEVLNQQPETVANNIGKMTQGGSGVGPFALTQAGALLWTLQAQSYYQSTAINNEANRGIVTGQIRVSQLDDATCAACASLHGTKMEIGESVSDHHNGRCTAIPVIDGSDMSWIGPSSGDEWFNSLPSDTQLEKLGPGKLDMLNSGDYTLSDFIDTYDDPVYGTMVREATIKDILAGNTKPL
jgi:hypothetical protein